ncbi:MAG: hypothetical protein ABJH44_11545, partial [Balneola sp.]
IITTSVPIKELVDKLPLYTTKTVNELHNIYKDDENNDAKLLATAYKPERITEILRGYVGKLALLDWDIGCWFDERSGMVLLARTVSPKVTETSP